MLTLTRAEFTRRINVDGVFRRRMAHATSPSPAAAELGVSRQRVYKMLDDGVLDGCRVVNATGETAFIVVFTDTVAARLKVRPARVAG